MAPEGNNAKGWKLGLYIVIALALTLLLFYILVTANVYPCSYNDVGTLAFSGYGYHSLADVLSNDFSWSADAVPHPYILYRGDGPYKVNAAAWTISLYIPILLGIIFLGLVFFKMFIIKGRHIWTIGSTIGQSCQKSNK
jgi:hypothetical protein